MATNLIRHEPVRNHILAGLPEEEFRLVRPHLTPVRLVPAQVLVEHDEAVEHVFFVEEGIVSVIDASRSGQSVQVAMIGREGLVGCQALLCREEPAFVSCITQNPGPALRIRLGELDDLIKQCPTLHRLCMAAIDALLRQSMQTAACNARNTLAQRCIRWLLMVHDRMEGDDLAITHEALSIMLGVRRSGITVVASGLQDAGLVRVNRGRITILDRAGLEKQAKNLSWSVVSQPRTSRAAPLERADLDAEMNGQTQAA